MPSPDQPSLPSVFDNESNLSTLSLESKGLAPRKANKKEEIAVQEEK